MISNTPLIDWNYMTLPVTIEHDMLVSSDFLNLSEEKCVISL